MKSLGYAVLFAGLVGGAILLGRVVSQMNAKNCVQRCPDKPDALKTHLNVGPLILQICNCGKVDSKAGEIE